jgi:hypothetical protein
MNHRPKPWRSLCAPRIGTVGRTKRLLLAALLSVATTAAFAQTSALRPAGPSEASVKAAYLLKFLNYVEWPATSFEAADAPYVVAVASDDAMLAELQRQAAGHIVGRHPVSVRRVSGNDLPAGLDVLFIGGHADRAHQATLLRQAKEMPVLLVTDAEGALELGSMINFRLVDERVRFEVALDPVKRAGLELNTRLLSVAIAVNKGTQP